MEYAIFPMKTISISQRFSSTHKAWDIVGSGTGKEYWYAPCRVKVLELQPLSTGFSNTVYFGSCDSNGNETEVMCEDGIARVLTFACTHIDTVDYNSFNYVPGMIFESGGICYMEGNTGNSTGNHVHVDIANGWEHPRIKQSDGQWCLENPTNMANVFHQLSGFNTPGNLNGYAFETVSSRIYSSQPSQISITGYALYTDKAAINIRSSASISGTIKATVPQNKELKIKYFMDGFQSDGWQWAATYYEGIEGFSRVETLNSYTVRLTNTSVIIPGTTTSITPKKLYVMSSPGGAYIRQTIASTGTVGRTKVPGNTRMEVVTLVNGVQSDGFQWVRVKYSGVTGYVQMDTKSWHYFTI